MADRETRTFAADLELRGADGRTVVGIAAPFGEIIDVGGRFREVIERGAFARTIAERGAQSVKFLALHDSRTMPLGRASLLREDAAGLYAELRISKTAAGDDALELIRDGALDGLSIGFVPVRDEWREQHSLVVRQEVKLHEISAVPFAAYIGARVSAVRSTTSLGAGSPDMLRRRLELELLGGN